MTSSPSAEELAQLSMMVKIFSPSQTYFAGSAKVVSAKNETGAFDILPLHHSFITLLPAGRIDVVADDQSKQSFDMEGGLMRVKENEVTIFIGF